MSVAGDHLKNRSSGNVTQYFARNLNIERFPGGLGVMFEALEVVRITSCNMRLLLKEDMENLSKLKYLDLVGNKIEKLESNTFENTPGILEVVLNNNRLRFIGSAIFEPLLNIQVVSFGGNTCISSQSKSSHEQLARIKTEINLKCSDVSMTDLMERFDSLETKLGELVKAMIKIQKSKESYETSMDVVTKTNN